MGCSKRMFEELKKNLIEEKKILKDLYSIKVAMQGSNEAKFYLSSMGVLLKQLKILNAAVPELLKDSSPLKSDKKSLTYSDIGDDKKIKSLEEKKTIEVEYTSPITNERRLVTLNKKDKKEFMQNLKFSQGAISKINKIQKIEEKDSQVFKPRAYARLSNKVFRGFSEKITPDLPQLSENLKKSNIPFLISTYISMATMSVFLSFILAIVIFGVLLAFSLSNWIYFWILILIPSLTASIFYLQPKSEANSLQKKISQELPFVTIHMATIASSEVEPTKIFKIIAMSKEYPCVGMEARKVLSQVEIYGYDLVTSLKNVSRITSNKKLSELFSGIATNISTGGSLKNYLEKKAENYLLDYKLERQRYLALAETFMDVYISILIAAPLVLMMIFIIMNVSGLGLGGLSITALLFISVGVVVLINFVFLIVLNMKQPKL